MKFKYFNTVGVRKYITVKTYKEEEEEEKYFKKIVNVNHICRMT